jgi:hypothetical protein
MALLVGMCVGSLAFEGYRPARARSDDLNDLIQEVRGIRQALERGCR